MMNSAVLFLIFNRKDTTMRVFEEIRKCKPQALYIAADGPRKNREGEAQICCDIQESILAQIDWECEVQTLFRDENLGCKKAISSAITWFFEHVEEGIILEDDCLPNQEFFVYCEELLERFRDNPRVMSISGSNLVDAEKYTDSSYFFNFCFSGWGWASWRRAWKLLDIDKKYSNYDLNRLMKTNNIDKRIRRFLCYQNFVMNHNLINTWDYPFCYTHWEHQAFCILPSNNLVSNIGFGSSGTHTKDANSKGANVKTSKILPLVHNGEIEVQQEAALRFYKTFWNYSSLRLFLKYTFRYFEIIKKYLFASE